MSSYGASLGALKDVLSDPKSSIWKGRGGRVTVVVLPKCSKDKESLDKGSTLRTLSASKENIIAGTKNQASKKTSMSRGCEDCGTWHDGGRLANFIRYRVASASSSTFLALINKCSLAFREVCALTSR
jgi:hypothetical protein